MSKLHSASREHYLSHHWRSWSNAFVVTSAGRDSAQVRPVVQVSCTSQIAREVVRVARQQAFDLLVVSREKASVLLHVVSAALAMAIEPPAEDPLQVAVRRGAGPAPMQSMRIRSIALSQLLMSMPPPCRSTTGTRRSSTSAQAHMASWSWPGTSGTRLRRVRAAQSLCCRVMLITGHAAPFAHIFKRHPALETHSRGLLPLQVAIKFIERLQVCTASHRTAPCLLLST
jgi:hypothetical protein